MRTSILLVSILATACSKKIKEADPTPTPDKGSAVAKPPADDTALIAEAK